MTNDEYLEKIKNTEEEWRQLILYHNLLNYDVSNIGRIRKHDTQKILKVSYNKEIINCYGFIQIKLPSGKILNTEIHRLVAIMFIPIPSQYIDAGYSQSTLTVDHIDGVKYHNIVENLEWVTQSENNKRAAFRRSNNITPYDSERISAEKADAICRLLSLGYPINIVALDLNVSENIVQCIRYKISWTEISQNYTFPSNRFSEVTIRLICEYISKGYTNNKIAELLSVSSHAVQNIRKRDVWYEISKDYVFPVKKINKETAIQICEMLQNGLRPKTISEELGVGKRLVEHIRRGESWTDVSKDYIFEYDKFKTSDEVVHNICKELEIGGKYIKDIAKDNNVSISFVKSIKYGKCRTDISKNYNIGLSK